MQYLFDLTQIPGLCGTVQYEHVMQDKERMEREKKRVKEKLEREKKKDEVAQSKAAEKLRQLQIREAKKAAEKAVKEQKAEERKRLQDEKRRFALRAQPLEKPCVIMMVLCLRPALHHLPSVLPGLAQCIKLTVAHVACYAHSMHPGLNHKLLIACLMA